MFELFVKGGPIMWPLLVTSLAAVTVVIERTVFIARRARSVSLPDRERLFALAQKGKWEEAIELGGRSRDSIVSILGGALRHRGPEFSDHLLVAAGGVIRPYERGLSLLDTIITLAPLLGLLGTVTGMISAFGLLGTSELGAPTAITGGIAEALIATAFGLAIAIVSLIPYNMLQSRVESVRRELEELGTRMELLVRNSLVPVVRLQAKEAA